MSRRAILAFAALVLLTGAAACEKTTTVATPTGPLQFDEFMQGASIPAEYGELVSVTSSASFPGWAQLWFQKPDSTIMTVFVNFQDGSVRNKVLVIPRS